MISLCYYPILNQIPTSPMSCLTLFKNTSFGMNAQLPSSPLNFFLRSFFLHDYLFISFYFPSLTCRDVTYGKEAFSVSPLASHTECLAHGTYSKTCIECFINELSSLLMFFSFSPLRFFCKSTSMFVYLQRKKKRDTFS